MKAGLSKISLRSSMLILTCLFGLSLVHGLGIDASESGPGGTKGMVIIDTHNHLFARIGPHGRDLDYAGVLTTALSTMDRFGIRKMFILPPPFPANYSGKEEVEDFLPYLKKQRDRFGYLGGGSSLNPMIQEAVQEGSVSPRVKEKFGKKALELASLGILGFGELTAEHFCLGDRHNYQSGPPDHPLFLLLAEIAADHHLPIDLHMEAVPEKMEMPGRLRRPPNPDLLSPNIAALERLLAHRRNAKIIWAHLGWDNTGERTTALTAKLLEKHPNLYMSIKTSPVDSMASTSMLEPGQGIKKEWLDLLRSYPDRFVIGTDQFYGVQTMTGSLRPKAPRENPGGGLPQKGTPLGGDHTGIGPSRVEPSMEFVSLLPPDLAKRIGCENAISLFNLRE